MFRVVQLPSSRDEAQVQINFNELKKKLTCDIWYRYYSTFIILFFKVEKEAPTSRTLTNGKTQIRNIFQYLMISSSEIFKIL